MLKRNNPFTNTKIQCDENTYQTIDSPSLCREIGQILTKQNVDYSYYGQLKNNNRENGSTKHTVQFNLNSLKTTLFGDMITPNIYINNSYNRECSFTITIGFIRWVCSNGMVCGEETFHSKIIHRKGETYEQKIKQLEYKIAASVEYIRSGKFVENIEKKLDKEVTLGDIQTIVDEMKLSDKRKKRILKIVANPRRIEDNSTNLWGLTNIINEEVRLTSRSEQGNFTFNTKLFDKVTNILDKAA